VKMFKVFALWLILSAGLSADNWLYVVNGTSETLSRINLATMAVQNHVLITGPVPNHAAIYEGLLYVVNSGSASLQIIDPALPRTIAEVALPLNSNPYWCDFWNGDALVSGFVSNSIYRVNLTTRQVIDTIPVGRSPAGVLCHAGRLYVAVTAFNPNDFSFGQGRVDEIDLASGQVVGTINVGKNPQCLAIGADGILNVICTGDYVSIRGMIYFVDRAARRVVDSLATGGDPFQVVINRYGIGYVSAGGWTGSGHVFSYDALNRILIRGESNPILVSTGAMGIALDSAGFIYSGGQLANSVTKFDGNGNVHGNFGVGAGPVSLAAYDSRTDIFETPSVQQDPIALGRPYPNPSNGGVMVPVVDNNIGSANILLDIYDVCGRLMITLNRAGSGECFYWDGLDRSGATLPSGVYLARLRGCEGTLKFTILR